MTNPVANNLRWQRNIWSGSVPVDQPRCSHPWLWPQRRSKSKASQKTGGLANIRKGEYQYRAMSQASAYIGTGLNSQGLHVVRSIPSAAMEYWQGQNHGRYRHACWRPYWAPPDSHHNGTLHHILHHSAELLLPDIHIHCHSHPQPVSPCFITSSILADKKYAARAIQIFSENSLEIITVFRHIFSLFPFFPRLRSRHSQEVPIKPHSFTICCHQLKKRAASHYLLSLLNK